MKKTISVLTAILIVLASFNVMAQKKMGLDDVTIKGDLHSSGRLKFYARQTNKLKNYVKFRKDYRDVIVEEVPLSLINEGDVLNPSP